MVGVDHSARKHALLSASGATRWLNCTPSARLEDKFNASKNSFYAQEGTLAHEFGDLNLRAFNGEITANVLSKELRKLRKDALFSGEMEEEVKKYTDYCEEAFNVARANDENAKMLVEERFDFSHLVQGGFGTGDNTILSDKIIEIIDLKYGKGIQVSAEDNSQLKLYGLGALRAFDMLYDIETVKLTIVQPRLNAVSTWEISVEDLVRWGEAEVRPKADKAFEGKGVQKAGDWCRWCKVKAMCATLAAKNVALARHEFKDPYLMAPKELLEVYKQTPMLMDWAKAVGDHLLEEAKKGKVWNGYKLVEGRSSRKWTDDEKVKEVLKEDFFEESEYMVSKLAGITAVQKLVGKDEINDLLGHLIHKPQGAPVLVENGDKRQPIGLAQAKQDFAD